MPALQLLQHCISMRRFLIQDSPVFQQLKSNTVKVIKNTQQ